MTGHGPVAAVSRTAILRRGLRAGTVEGVDEEAGIYREEVILMMGALADITTDTRR